MGKKLAIKGHSTRGKEVIGLLEIMGGHATIINEISNETDKVFFISDNENCFYRKSIRFIPDSSKEMEDFNVFTLEEFLEKYPFKVSDFVRIPEYESEVQICKMKWDQICQVVEYLVYRNDDEEWYTVDELLEYNDNPIKTRACKKCGLHFGSVRCFDKDCPHNTPKTKKENKINQMPLDDDDKLATEVTIMGKRILPPDGYLVGKITKTDNGIIVEYVNKEPKYPTTYAECYRVLGISDGEFMFTGLSDNEYDLFNSFVMLRRCRNAYWKIAGDEMGLDKPWEPEYVSLEDNTYFTIQTFNGEIDRSATSHRNAILAFPTVEMRDAFYDNFKDLIESCKELL